MDEERLQAVVEAMSPQEYPAGSLLIREGESGSHLFVSAHGQFEVLKAGHVVKNFGPGEAFGELAILYKAKRFASIRCKLKISYDYFSKAQLRILILAFLEFLTNLWVKYLYGALCYIVF